MSSWLSEQTVALKVQFTLYSPAPNLFSSVTLLSEKRSTGLFQSSSTVQSVRVYHSPSKLDYTVMLCQVNAQEQKYKQNTSLKFTKFFVSSSPSAPVPPLVSCKSLLPSVHCSPARIDGILEDNLLQRGSESVYLKIPTHKLDIQASH